MTFTWKDGLIWVNLEVEYERRHPEYHDRKVVGAVAGIEIVENADTFAYRQGLFVIVRSGEMVTMLNDEKFKPKVWTRP